MKSTLRFLGAAGTVTGSRHLLETDLGQLLVDCGLFQGRKENRLLNWEPFPVDPSGIGAIALTHAHIDHIGYLPRLVKEGFRGRIYGTRATIDLAHILLRDAAHLQEEEARWANKKGYSKHQPALPLFTPKDAERVFPLFHAVTYGERFSPLPGMMARYGDTGHILGSAFLEVWRHTEGRRRKLVFGGDLGRPHDSILPAPTQPYNVDYLVLESTYGDRLHSTGSLRKTLVEALGAALQRGGPVIVPSFAVGRTQELLFLIRELEESGDIPTVPVHVDSPMALQALEVHRDHIRDLNLACRKLHIEGVELFQTGRLSLVSTVDDSKKLVQDRRKRIIIAGSGMATGGRVLHHLAHHLPNPECTVLFVGYQAEGTRGRSLVEGAQTLRMFGQEVPVRARVECIDGFSGHADTHEILAWLLAFNQPVRRVFMVHGEPEASEALGRRITEEFGWPTVLPRQGQSFEIDW